MTHHPDPPVQRVDRESQLANRAALLTLATLCAFLLALVTMPLTFQRTERTAARVIASAPLAVGLGVAAVARVARGQLRAYRDDAPAHQPEQVSVDDGTVLPKGRGRSSSS